MDSRMQKLTNHHRSGQFIFPLSVIKEADQKKIGVQILYDTIDN